MRVIRLFSSVSSRLFWVFKSFWVVCIILLLTVKGSVNAQTSTPPPGFSTAVPVASGTPNIPVVNDTVYYDFRSGQGDFAVTLGTWESGIGFISDTGILTVLGGYTFDETLSQVTFFYTSTAAGDFDFAVNDGVPPSVFEDSAVFPLCADTDCAISFSVPGVTFSNLAWAVDAGLGDIIVYGLELGFGGVGEDYDVDESGCPLLSPEQLRRIDPLYFATCSRCFVTPTPVRDQPIPSLVLKTPTPNSTLETTFQVPVIVSGTPQTPTPAGDVVPGGGLFTLTPSPLPSSTPGGASCLTNGDGGGAGAWLPIDIHVSVPYSGTYNAGADRWEGVYAPGTDAKLLRIRRAWDGSAITSIAVYVAYDSALSSSSTAIICQITANGSVGSVDTGDTLAVAVSNTHPSSDAGYLCVYNNPLGLEDVVSLDVITSAFSNGSNGYTYIESVQICGLLPGTQTPIPTYTPMNTGVPWFATPDLSDADCSVAKFGNFDPVAQFDPQFKIVSSECYTIVPEIDIDVPGQDNLQVDGVQLCITWFGFPVIELMGIVVTLDWLLILVIGFLVYLLLRF